MKNEITLENLKRNSNRDKYITILMANTIINIFIFFVLTPLLFSLFSSVLSNESIVLVLSIYPLLIILTTIFFVVKSINKNVKSELTTRLDNNTNDVVWIYKRRTRITLNIIIPISTVNDFVICFRDGRRLPLSTYKYSFEKWQKFFVEYFPNAIWGYSKELEKEFLSDINLFLSRINSEKNKIDLVNSINS